MAESIKEIKKRINSTKKTGQITKAMYMVSQSKVKRSEKSRLSYQSFIEEISSLTKTALEKEPFYQSILLEERENKKVAYILVTSDTGLAGGYNNQIFRYFNELVQDKKDFIVATIGRKGFNYAKNKGYELLNDSAVLIRDDVMFLDIVPIVNGFIKLYKEGNVDHLYIIYNHYVNSLTCEVKMEQVLPVSEIEGTSFEGQYVFEDDIEDVLTDLITMYIQADIYKVVLDAKSSEHSSRMNAMKNASDNVDEIVKKYELIYNRARQQAITTELVDIISGANALKVDTNEQSIDSINNSLYKTYSEKGTIKFVTIYSNSSLAKDEEKKIVSVLESYYKPKKIHLIKKIDETITKGYRIMVDNKVVEFNLDNIIKNLRDSL